MQEDRRGSALRAGQSVSASAVARELAAARSVIAAAAHSHPALRPAIRALERIERRLKRRPRVAIVGEFNSGKSSLANVLIGHESLPTAVISNTRIPTLLYHAPSPEVSALLHNGERRQLRVDQLPGAGPIARLDVGLPAPGLKTFEILDLPGLADATFEHGDVIGHTHATDAVLWCTVSAQAWKESERMAWLSLPSRLRAHGILVVTHWDLLRDPQDRAKLMSRLEAEAGDRFAHIAPISAREALRALTRGSREEITREWKASGAARLDAALLDLVRSVGEERVASALALTQRIVEHALKRL